MTGTVGILNVGAGDTKLVFDKDNPADCIRAARIVKDMLRRGYALLVEIGKDKKGQPRYQRALDFDETRCEYIIADFDPLVAQEADANEEQQQQTTVAAPDGETEVAQAAAGGAGRSQPRKGRAGRTRRDATKTGAVAVARTAGG